MSFVDGSKVDFDLMIDCNLIIRQGDGFVLTEIGRAYLNNQQFNHRRGS